MPSLFPDSYRRKILQLIADGLDGETIARRFLDGQVPIDLAYFLIDLDLEGEVLETWLSCISPELARESRQKIKKALDSSVPQLLVQIFKHLQLTPKAIKESLYALAATSDPEILVDLLLDNDFNAYDLHHTLTRPSEDNLWKRFTRLEKLLKAQTRVQEIMKAYAESIDFEDSNATDQLILAKAIGLDAAGFRLLSGHLQVPIERLTSHAPFALTAELEKAGLLQAEQSVLVEAFAKVNAKLLGQKLFSREKARSRWFQTVGANVRYVYSGILHRATPGSITVFADPVKDKFNLPPKSLMQPDFQIIFYADGGVRAKQIGIDGLRSDAHRIQTIGHAYEGNLDDGTVQLIESNDYGPHPERPTLGDLIFTDVAFDPTGMQLTFHWRGKPVKLRWDPGF